MAPFQACTQSCRATMRPTLCLSRPALAPPIRASSESTPPRFRQVPELLLSAAAAAALLTATPALAISGGKGGTSGSYTPLDDADLSGRDLRQTAYTKGSLRRATFDNSNLAGVSFFGALCKQCSFVGSDLSGAILESADLEGADLTNAVLEGAMVTNAGLRKVTITGSDWTDVNLRKDQQAYLCSIADGTNPTTGVDTRESLFCPPVKK